MKYTKVIAYVSVIWIDPETKLFFIFLFILIIFSLYKVYIAINRIIKLYEIKNKSRVVNNRKVIYILNARINGFKGIIRNPVMK